MSGAWRDAGGALSWGFWLGVVVAMVVLTIDAILHGAAAGQEAAAGLDRIALWRQSAIGFAAGFVAGALAHLYLRGLEKKAETRPR
jgi:hydrogenase/urease accessory protein HupE